MPFGFGRKKESGGTVGDASGIAAADARGPRVVPFHGITEEWRLRATMTIEGRMLDTLNKREAIALNEVVWAPLDGSSPFEPAPGIRTVDPYDLIVVIAGPETLLATGEAERSAHRVHKVSFDVSLTVPPLRVTGRVQLHPGSEPDGLLDRSSAMFVALTLPTVLFGDGEIDLGEDADAALVNRFYLRGVDQVDLATGERPMKLPGQSLGGTNWRERAR